MISIKESHLANLSSRRMLRKEMGRGNPSLALQKKGALAKVDGKLKAGGIGHFWTLILSFGIQRFFCLLKV